MTFWCLKFSKKTRAEIHQIFALFFFEKLKTPKSHSEINWPLVEIIIFSLCHVIIRTTKIINSAGKNWAHFQKIKYLNNQNFKKIIWFPSLNFLQKIIILLRYLRWLLMTWYSQMHMWFHVQFIQKMLNDLWVRSFIPFYLICFCYDW